MSVTCIQSISQVPAKLPCLQISPGTFIQFNVVRFLLICSYTLLDSAKKGYNITPNQNLHVELTSYEISTGKIKTEHFEYPDEIEGVD